MFEPNINEKNNKKSEVDNLDILKKSIKFKWLLTNLAIDKWMENKYIDIEKILPSRFNPSRELINSYLKLNTKVPPIVLIESFWIYKILDGHHRFEVAKLKWEKKICAYIFRK